MAERSKEVEALKHRVADLLSELGGYRTLNNEECIEFLLCCPQEVVDEIPREKRQAIIAKLEQVQKTRRKREG